MPNPHFGQYEEGKIHPEIQNIRDIGKIKHDYLVKMSETNPPLANPFYVYREFAENSSEFLIQNEKIKL